MRMHMVKTKYPHAFREPKHIYACMPTLTSAPRGVCVLVQVLCASTKESAPTSTLPAGMITVGVGSGSRTASPAAHAAMFSLRGPGVSLLLEVSPFPTHRSDVASLTGAHTLTRPAGRVSLVGVRSERSSLSPGKRLHHQRSSRHAMVPLSDTSPNPGG
jgi:hypothetical protein